MVKPWLTHKRERVLDCRVFAVESTERENPSTKQRGRFFVLDSPDWVNIIPITRDNSVILVRQYRHGMDGMTLELPGGLVEKGEDPRIAAQRECEEETGFRSQDEAILLGSCQPNPAIQNNITYSYMWLDCDRTGRQSFDQHEDIEVVEVPLDQLDALVDSGDIRHTLVLTTFYYFRRYHNTGRTVRTGIR